MPSDTAIPIILISIDTLRADHLGCYGYSRDTSPNIDRFAAESVVFDQFVNSGGGTLPVHMSMLTSLSPTVHDVYPHNGRALADLHATLAEVLAAHGYGTGGFVDGGYLSASFGFDQGFDVYFDRNFKGIGGKLSSYFDRGGFAELMPRARRWLGQSSTQPFFLFLHTYDVHSGVRRLTYDAPEPFQSRYVASDWAGSFDGCRVDRCASELLRWVNRGVRAGEIDGRRFFSPQELEYIVALYDGGIAYTDHELGRFFDFLRNRGLYDRSLIVVTADHGEEFLEHGLMLHHQNYEEVAKVPLVIRLPGGQRAGVHVGGLFSTIDLMPTLLDLSGFDTPPEAMGTSMRAAIFSPQGGQEYVFIAGGTEKLRSSRWSLLASRDTPLELYDLTVDPREESNVIGHFPGVAEELFARLQATRAREIFLRDGVANQARVALDQRQREELRALGYLQ